ncbi:hypothetical protein N657DRAFT_626802 [Parathielavia appendiculata]|uniref:Uncharacterized protein n=1 Tax=Parathielavia appendiculata TaxID=2587402 RepID=A0AAN6TRY5_9PEZI|nr:hypothetical protein N657DRAFT_626802 [Parathielavia appendiculata]
MPQDAQDERFMGRCFQLLKAAQGRALRVERGAAVAVRASFVKNDDQDGETNDVADKSDPPENPFADVPLRDLWDQGLEANNRYWLIRKMVLDGERQFPSQWGLPISISECSIDE